MSNDKSKRKKNRKNEINKNLIGKPTDFRYFIHHKIII